MASVAMMHAGRATALAAAGSRSVAATARLRVAMAADGLARASGPRVVTVDCTDTIMVTKGAVGDVYRTALAEALADKQLALPFGDQGLPGPSAIAEGFRAAFKVRAVKSNSRFVETAKRCAQSPGHSRTVCCCYSISSRLAQRSFHVSEGFPTVGRLCQRLTGGAPSCGVRLKAQECRKKFSTRMVLSMPCLTVFSTKYLSALMGGS